MKNLWWMTESYLWDRELLHNINGLHRKQVMLGLPLAQYWAVEHVLWRNLTYRDDYRHFPCGLHRGYCSSDYCIEHGCCTKKTNQVMRQMTSWFEEQGLELHIPYLAMDPHDHTGTSGWDYCHSECNKISEVWFKAFLLGAN